MTGFKKLIFWLHLCCGILAGLVVFAMSITGAVLTYEKQITRWADGFDVSPPVHDAHRLGPAALLQRAHAESGKRPSGIQFSSSPEEPARVYFGRESVTIDPDTGVQLGEGATGVRRFFRTMTSGIAGWDRRATAARSARRSPAHAISASCSSSLRARTCGGRRAGLGSTYGRSSSSGAGYPRRPGTSTGTTSSVCGAPSRSS